ncbi:hypothetical protein ACH5RR_032920 [Cinchona calisaya]|uniref:At1g61320/AtMIF1 LRR domain-containing protein n=1 Tax=Cinchona calisaya TaxID=153742 RepID=A0ABD2YJH8_9GENT
MDGSTRKNTDIQVLEKRQSDFINCIDTTLLRYHEHKNGIDCLKLILPSVLLPDYISRWIQIAIEKSLKSLDIYITDCSSFILPLSVLEAKTLVELSLGKLWLKPEYAIYSIRLKEFSVVLKFSGCVEVEAPSLEYSNYSELKKILSIFGPGIQSIHRGLKMYASRNLKRLRLCDVGITDEFFADIAEKFPQLVMLDIEKCGDLQRIKISSHSIKRIHLEWNGGLKEVEIDVSSINEFEYEGSKIPLFSFTAPFGCSWVSVIVLHYWEWMLFDTFVYPN